jgi:hypothetical protein
MIAVIASSIVNGCERHPALLFGIFSSEKATIAISGMLVGPLFRKRAVPLRG